MKENLFNRVKNNFPKKKKIFFFFLLLSDSNILNGVNWTSSLDEVFKENHKMDPNIGWQFFGSFHGFLRVYPAFRLDL